MSIGLHTTEPFPEYAENGDSPYFLARRTPQGVAGEGRFEYSWGNTIDPARSADWAKVSWTWNGDTLHVANDRYGMLPLFYFNNAREIGVSSRLDTLSNLGASLELNDQALAVFLRMGHFIGDSTPFKHIHLLPPRSVLTWKDGITQITSDPPHSETALDISREEAIETYIELFRRATRRCCLRGERIALPMSGGVDSRHILAVLCELGFKPDFCVTARYHTSHQSDDSQVAAEVARYAGLPHVVLTQPRTDLDLHLSANSRLNYLGPHHVWLMVVANYLSGRADAIFDGIGGDVLSAGHRLNAKDVSRMESEQFAELSAAILRREIEEKYLRNILSPAMCERFDYQIAGKELAKELARHAKAVNPMSDFIFWNRTRRFIAHAPYAMLRAVVGVHSPFLDPEVYDFLTSLPASMFLNKAFHRDAIRWAYPDFARIPYAKSVPSPRFHSIFHSRSTEFMKLCSAHRKSKTLRWRSLLPRIAYGMCCGAKTGSDASIMASYFLQLESLVFSRQSSFDLHP
jgi:asparagine synthetase B (glutamine-hydrolysing)